MGPDLHGPATRRRGRRPAHVPGPHPRDRCRVVPAPDEPREAEGGTASGLITRPIEGQSNRSGVGPVLMITVGTNGVVIPRNPPFLRYHHFQEEHREPAFRLMRSAGLHPSRLTNAWVPFVVAASRMLTDRGRLAMVLQAELNQVRYEAT